MGLELILVGLLLVLIVLAAALAVGEVSLLRARRVRFEIDAERGDRSARLVLRLLDRLPLVLNTILLTVLFVQVSAAAISGYLAQRWFGGPAITIATIVVTFVLFVYTEAIPKTLALRDPERSVRSVASPVAALVRLGRPVTALLLRLADLQTPGVGATAQSAFSEDEIRMLADEAARVGEIEREDADLVNRSFEFGDLVVGDVLVPRAGVVAAHDSTSPRDALDVAVAAGHRRLVVHRGDLDAISGIVRLRELAAAASAGTPATIGSLVRRVLRVGRDMPVADLLGRMQQTGLRFAIVQGAHDVTEGIVTIEDIVTELVGEIEEPD